MLKKICVLFTLIFLSACANVQTWKYTSEQKSYNPPKIKKTVVVSPFRDTRSNKNDSKYAILAMLPLVPYSKLVEYNTPEGFALVLSMGGSVTEVLAKTTATELDSASVFKNTYFDFNTKKADNELILEGTLKEFKLEKYWTFYGLTPIGDLLWYLGLPAGKAYNTITIHYRLVDKNGKEFFNKEYKQQEVWIQGLYYGLENFRLEKLMKQINMDLVNDLKQLNIKY